MAGAADKRIALPIFVGAWCFSDEANLRRRITHSEYGLRSTASQFGAALAGCNFNTDDVQGRRPLFRSNHDLAGWRRIEQRSFQAAALRRRGLFRHNGLRNRLRG